MGHSYPLSRLATAFLIVGLAGCGTANPNMPAAPAENSNPELAAPVQTVGPASTPTPNTPPTTTTVSPNPAALTPGAPALGPPALGPPAPDPIATPVTVAPAPPANTPPPVAGSPVPTPAELTFVGRFDVRNPQQIRFDWPNSSIGVQFTGTGISVGLIELTASSYNGVPVHNFYDVFIDNNAPTQLQVGPGSQIYSLALGLSSGSHTLWLRRRTEAQIGAAAFTGFQLAAGGTFLTPPSVRPRQLELVSDSGGTGYGADANVTRANMCHFTDSLENADYSYGKLLADLVNAEFTNLSYSGKGIATNLNPGDPVTLPKLYGRTLASDPSGIYAGPEGNADVVVVDTGGNDLVGAWGAGTLDQPAFVAAYANLLGTIRQRNPRAAIFACVGHGAGLQDRTTLRNAITAVVQTANQGGDAKVFFFEFPEYDGHLNYGCDFHPDHATAALLAAEILPQVQAKLP